MNDIEQSIFNKCLDNTMTLSFNYFKSMLINYCNNLVHTLFTWEFPEEVNASSFQIECSLFWNNTVAFVKSDIGYYILPCDILNYNVFYEPNTIVLNSNFNTGQLAIIGKQYSDNFIVCYNDLSHNYFKAYLLNLIENLASLLEIQYTLYRKMRQPYLVATTDKTILNSKTMLNNAIQKDYILTDKDKIEDIKVLNLEIDHENVRQLQEKIDDLYTKLHGIIGLSFSKDIKKERLISSEVYTSNQFKDMLYMSKLKARQEFCNKINDKYGLEVKVNENIADIQSKALDNLQNIDYNINMSDNIYQDDNEV